jgi:hypothetical protein
MTEIPPHIKRDVQKLSYDRSVGSIDRICDTFGRSADMLMISATGAMAGAFLMMYCAARLKYNHHIAPEKLLKIWGETMEKEFEMMTKGFESAEEYTRKHHGN